MKRWNSECWTEKAKQMFIWSNFFFFLNVFQLTFTTAASMLVWFGSCYSGSRRKGANIFQICPAGTRGRWRQAREHTARFCSATKPWLCVGMDGSLWRVETLLYEHWECKLSDGLTRESTADWRENQNGNKVWDELICRFKSLYSQIAKKYVHPGVIVQWNREARSVAL